MSSTSSRRSFIASTSLLATGSIMPAAAIAAAPSAQATNPRLHRLIALHDRAEAECERFDIEVELPAHRAWGEAVRAYPAESPPPHEQSSTTFVNAFGDTVRLSTEGVGTGAVAKRVVNDPTWADMGDDDWRQAHREIAAAYDRREALLAQQAARRNAFEDDGRARFRIDAINARSDELGDRRVGFWLAAINTPPGNLADLITKLDFIDRTTAEDEQNGEVRAAVFADVRRLVGEA